MCFYDLFVILHKPNASKTISYVLFMVEKSLAVAVVLLLNFLPSVKSDVSQNKSALKLWIYKAVLLLYALEGYTMAILGSIIAVYKVLTVSDTRGIALIKLASTNVYENLTLASAQQRLQWRNNGYSTMDPPDMKAVVDLMLLMTNNALRYYLADFFFSKFFDHDVDILRGGTKSISESLAVNRADDIPTAEPTQELDRCPLT